MNFLQDRGRQIGAVGIESLLPASSELEVAVMFSWVGEGEGKAKAKAKAFQHDTQAPGPPRFLQGGDFTRKYTVLRNELMCRRALQHGIAYGDEIHGYCPLP